MTPAWVLITAFFLLLGRSVQAATIGASALNPTLLIAESTEATITLRLDAFETASIFEGRFDLVGLGSVAGVLLTPGGPSWDSSFGGIVGSQARLSLTSSNVGGDRLVSTLLITGLATGRLDITLAGGTFVQRDVDAPPFFENVPLLTPPGSVLASIEVVPEPATGPLIGLGLVGIATLRGCSRSLPRGPSLLSGKKKMLDPAAEMPSSGVVPPAVELQAVAAPIQRF